MEDKGYFGLEVLDEGIEGFGTGGCKFFIFLVHFSICEFNLIDFLKAFFLNIFKLDMMETFPEIFLECLKLGIKFVNKFLIIIKNLSLLNFIFLSH